MAAKALIVLAHPAKQSLSSLFASTAFDKLQAQGFETHLLDLYAEGFNPVLTAHERVQYYAAGAQWTNVQFHTALLRQADFLILIFPTWWFGLPAILKGWLDRIFVPGIAFDNASDFGPIKPGLINLKRVLVITTLGSPWWIDWLVLRRPVLRVLKRAVFGLCAPQAKFEMLSFYAAEKPEPSRIASFKNRIAASLTG